MYDWTQNGNTIAELLHTYIVYVCIICNTVALKSFTIKFVIFPLLKKFEMKDYRVELTVVLSTN